MRSQPVGPHRRLATPKYERDLRLPVTVTTIAVTGDERVRVMITRQYSRHVRFSTTKLDPVTRGY